jgi:hypothetical protein
VKKLVWTLLISALCAPAALGQLPLPDRGIINDPVEGKAIIDDLLDQRPSQHSEFYGVLRTRQSRARREIPVRYHILPDHSEEGAWRGIYQTQPANGLPAEKLVIQHLPGQPKQYALAREPQPAAGLPTPQKLGADQLWQPFAHTDFWIADLGLEFLHWPEQILVKREMRRSRSCRVIESINPNPVPGAYTRVLSWLDVETNGLVIAEAYDGEGTRFSRPQARPVKVFEVSKISRVNGVYQVKELEIRNEKTDSRTQLLFHFELE